MSSSTTQNDPKHIPKLTVSAARLAILHTYLSFAAFFSALFIGLALHYKKIVKNGVAGYPEEWFPSVSATYVHTSLVRTTRCELRVYRIGDWYPERNIFQILIALNSGASYSRSGLCMKADERPRSSLRDSASAILPSAETFPQIVNDPPRSWHSAHPFVRRLGVHYFK